MRGGLKMEAYDLENCIRGEGEPFSEKAPQKGSMILEAIIVLGMIATFTPLLYKHVADRRADIENINRANTLIYLQQKTEEYLKDPDNITDLVNELGHNQHKEIFPSELGIGDNFDGRYIIGIRREDEQNKPVLKAMIIDTVNTGSDLRAAKVAELIGISAGIYTAVDPDAAWGINGTWSEPLSRYFDTTDIPTGAVAVTTEYNKEKYRVSMSDIVVDSDLDMGEFELTAEQINAINLAAQSGTIDQLTSQNVNATTEVTSPAIVSTGRICFRKNGENNCIESWEGLGGGEGQDTTDLMLVQMCNAGITDLCRVAFNRGINTSCSSVDAVYAQAEVDYPVPKIYNLTYGTGNTYQGYVSTLCEGTQFVVENISTSTLTDPVEQVGGSAFAITQPGWYQITLKGEAGTNAGATPTDIGAGGILIANGSLQEGAILILKGIKGYTYREGYWGGAGIGLWNTIATTTTPPLLSAGGGSSGVSAGGYEGSICTNGQWPGYNWDGSAATTTIPYCYSLPCDLGATGGAWVPACRGGTGTGYTGINCPTGYTCTTVTGGNWVTNSANYPASTFGNWNADHSKALGYASIVYCGSSESDCPMACSSDEDCSGSTPYCDYSKGRCSTTRACATDSNCPSALPYCSNGVCATTKACSANSDCSAGNKPYCVSSQCSNVLYSASIAGGLSKACSGSVNTVATVTAIKGKHKFDLRGGGIAGNNGYGGGTWTATKTFTGSTSLEIRQICGGHTGTYWGYSGVGLLEGSTIKLVAGGAGIYTSSKGGGGGGGYVGGWCGSYNGYSWDGTKGSSQVASGAGTGGRIDQVYGGTGYCASGYSCSGTYGSNSGNAYISITYCGPSSSSTCP